MLEIFLMVLISLGFSITLLLTGLLMDKVKFHSMQVSFLLFTFLWVGSLIIGGLATAGLWYLGIALGY